MDHPKPLQGSQIDRICQVGKTHNPLVAGSSPARPTSQTLGWNRSAQVCKQDGQRRAEVSGHRVESRIAVGGQQIGGVVNAQRRLPIAVGICDHHPQRHLHETSGKLPKTMLGLHDVAG